MNNGDAPRNPWFGINAANGAAQLRELVENAKLQRAINLRTAAQVLGVPPAQLEDDMIAGGNITVNRGSSWPWISGATVLAAAIVAAAWLISGRPDPVKPVVPSPAPASPTRGNDYIEFYKP